MRNPLYEELVELDYVPIKKLDEELPPEFVLLHLKNLSQENQRFIIESIDTSIQYLAHQNPSMEQFQDQENAVQFCLALVPYTPTVIIDDIAEIVNPEYPYRFTITGSISTTEIDIPNSVTVLYGDTIAQANFINDTNKWTLTLDLDEIKSTTLQSLSAVGTVFNIESGKISPESDRTYKDFLVRFPIELVLLPVENVTLSIIETLILLPVENVSLTIVEDLVISCEGAIDSIGIGDIDYEHVVKVNGIEIDLLNDVISSSDGIYTVQKGDIIFLAKLEIEAAIGFKNDSVNNLAFEIDVSSNPYDEPIHTNWIKPAFGQPDNPTYYYDAVNKIITFCLSPTINGGDDDDVDIPPSDDEEIPPSDDEEIPPSDDEDVILYDALKSLTIEAFYIEEEAIHLLKPEYQNLNGMSGHLCNRAQFKVSINGLNIGHVNLNNEGGGQPYPRNTENNGISAITNNGEDYYNAKYSRIDVTEEQAQVLAKLDDRSLLNISLSELIPDPHHGVTWVRLSVRTESGSLVKLYDQLVTIGYKYTIDILRPELGLIESLDNSKKLKYVKDFKAKRNVDDDFQPVAYGVDVSEGTSIELKVEVADDFSDELDIVYSLPNGAPLGVQLNGNIITVDNGVSLFKENITVGYKVTTVLDPLNTLKGVFTFKLSVFDFDLSASVVYKQNGVWKSLEVGTTIPNGTLYETWDVTDVIINDKVTRIGNNCFNAKFLSLKLSNNLTYVGDNCFMWLNYISDLPLPNTLTHIGEFSFNKLGKDLSEIGSTEKATLNIPTNLKEIKDGVFNEWAVGWGRLDLQNTAITTIGYSFNSMFVKEYNSIDVYLPDGLTTFNGFTYARIRKVVFGRHIEIIRNLSFNSTREHYSNGIKLPEIVILRSDIVVEPLGTSPLGNLGFSSGRKLYVPTNLVSGYQASTQWAKLISSENIIGINPDTYE